MSSITFGVKYAQAFARGVQCPLPPQVTIDVDPAAIPQPDRDLLASRLNNAGYVCSRTSDGLYTRYTRSVHPGGGEERRETTLTHRMPETTVPRPMRRWDMWWQESEQPELVTADEPTLPALLDAIRAEEAAIAGKREASRAAAAAEDAARRAAVDAWLSAPDEVQMISTDPYYWPTSPLLAAAGAGHRAWDGTHRFRGYTYSTVVHGDYRAADVAAKKGRLESLVAARNAEIVERLVADHVAAANERAAWIATHGSARLRRLVAEGIGHDKTYASERAKYDQGLFDAALATERPGWTEVAADDVTMDVADVSARALALLDAARAIAPHCRLGRQKSTGKYVAVEAFRGKTIIWPRD